MDDNERYVTERGSDLAPLDVHLTGRKVATSLSAVQSRILLERST